MVKVHTRIKRKLDTKSMGRNRAKRPKTFSSQEDAKAYAKTLGEGEYELIDMSLNPNKPKIKVVSK